jgi:hypothetical protein
MDLKSSSDRTKTREYQNRFMARKSHQTAQRTTPYLAVNESFGFQAGSSMSPTCLETLPGGAHRLSGVSGGEQPAWLPTFGRGKARARVRF